MAHSESLQERYASVSQNLDIMSAALESAKDSLKSAGKDMESKGTKIEDDKLRIEDKNRLVIALKKEFEKIQNSQVDDFESWDKGRNSIESLKNTLNAESKTAQNGEKTTNSESVEWEKSVEIEVWENPGVINVKGGEETEEAVQNPNEREKSEAQRSDDSNSCGISKSCENISDCSSSPLVVSERTKEASERAKKKPAPPHGVEHEMFKKEFEVAKEKSVRPKEKRKLAKNKTKINNALEPSEGKSLQPEENPGVFEEKFNELWDKYMYSDETSDLMEEEFELTQEESLHRNESSSGIAENPPYQNISAYYEGMDNPLNAMLFSEELIEYVLDKLGYKWPSQEGARNLPEGTVPTRFTNLIGETMIAIIDSNIGMIAESYKQLVEKNVRTVTSFRIEACITATFYFYDEFTLQKFLIYAAQMAGLSAFYFASGSTEIADGAAQVLAYILNYYTYQLWFQPCCDWFSLHLEAQGIRNQIQERKIKFVLPTGSLQPRTE